MNNVVKGELKGRMQLKIEDYQTMSDEYRLHLGN